MGLDNVSRSLFPASSRKVQPTVATLAECSDAVNLTLGATGVHVGEIVKR